MPDGEGRATGVGRRTASVRASRSGRRTSTPIDLRWTKGLSIFGACRRAWGRLGRLASFITALCRGFTGNQPQFAMLFRLDERASCRHRQIVAQIDSEALMAKETV